MGEDQRTPSDTTDGEDSAAAPETDTPVRSAATQRWLDAVVEAVNRLDGDEAMRRRVAQRIFQRPDGRMDGQSKARREAGLCGGHFQTGVCEPGTVLPQRLPENNATLDHTARNDP